MIKKTSRILMGVLLAIAPAALRAQVLGRDVVVRKDTVVLSKVDTVVRMRPDTVLMLRPDTVVTVRVVPAGEDPYKTQTLPMPLPGDSLGRAPKLVMPVPHTQAAQATVPAINEPLDSVIARAVRLGVQQALQERDKGVRDGSEHQTAAERIWGQSQEKRKIQRVPRELLKSTFVPKGQWLVGGTIGFQEWDTDNVNLLVLKDIDFEGHTFSASPYFGYFVAKNIAVGGRYSYKRNYAYLGNLDLNLGEDFNISLDNLYYLAHTHTLSSFVRTYQSLGKSNIFGFFSEIRASYAYSREKNTTGSGADYEGSFARSHSLQLTFCPGLAVFVTDFLAAEASIGVMGLQYRWKDQHTNRVESGSSKNYGANFKFNLLSINLGLTFYL